MSVHVHSAKPSHIVFFLALAAVSTFFIHGIAFRQKAISDPALQDARCLRGPFPVTYDFLSPALNNLLCYICTTFKAVSFKPESLLGADGFARWGFACAAILGAESARTGQPWIVRRANWFLLAAQLVTGAVMLPLYFVATSIYASKHNPPKAPILAERAWAALFAALGGFVLPSYFVQASGWSYQTLAIWQLFPIYLSVLQTVLAPLLAPFVRRTGSSVPIILIGLIGVALSCPAHFAMLTGDIPLQKIFWPFWENAEGLPDEAHRFFIWDFAGCVIALSSYLVLAYGGHGTGSKIGSLVVLAILTALVGPGGAAAVFWSGTVVFAPETGKVDEKLE